MVFGISTKALLTSGLPCSLTPGLPGQDGRLRDTPKP